MNWLFNISILASILTFSCQGPSEETEKVQEETVDDTSLIYIHPNGELLISEVNDSVWNVRFENLEGHVFDSNLVEIKKANAFEGIRLKDEIAYLKIGLGGISFSETQMKCFEFGGWAVLQTHTQIPDIYTNPWVRKNKEISIKGVLYHSKSLVSVNGIYITEENDMESGTYVEVNGWVKREEWPEEYYSTDESPQGFVSENEKNRIVFQQPKIKIIADQLWIGYPVNVSDGRAAIAWEFADSEAFILEGHAPWTEEELSKKIKVTGELVQDETGSYLKNWEIIE